MFRVCLSLSLSLHFLSLSIYLSCRILHADGRRTLSGASTLVDDPRGAHRIWCMQIVVVGKKPRAARKRLSARFKNNVSRASLTGATKIRRETSRLKGTGRKSERERRKDARGDGWTDGSTDRRTDKSRWLCLRWSSFSRSLYLSFLLSLVPRQKS